MDSDEPGLFEMDVEAPARGGNRRGRRRETWTCTTTATVAIRDVDAIVSAFNSLEEAAYVVDDLAAGDEDADKPAGELSPMAQLAWLVWPTAGTDRALEVDAFRIDSVEVECLEDHGCSGTLRWTLEVKLRDVDALRRLAREACPEDAALIADDLTAAWRRVIDPYAPLHPIAGIDWDEGTVAIGHIPARARP